MTPAHLKSSPPATPQAGENDNASPATTSSGREVTPSTMPAMPDMSSLLQGLSDKNPTGTPLQGRQASAQGASAQGASAIATQNLQTDILEILGRYPTIPFRVKNFDIAPNPDGTSSVSLSIACKYSPQNKETLFQAMEQMYIQIQQVLLTHTDPNNTAYTDSNMLSQEQQAETTTAMRALLTKFLPNPNTPDVNSILTFHNNRPIISLPPTLEMSSAKKEELALEAITLFAPYNTMHILVIGEITLAETDAPEEKTSEVSLNIKTALPVKGQETEEEEATFNTHRRQQEEWVAKRLAGHKATRRQTQETEEEEEESSSSI